MGVYWSVFVFAFILANAIALTRKGKVASDRIGSLRRELHSDADPQAVFDRIAAIGAGKIKVDDKNAETKQLVLSSPMSFAGWGFLYPVSLHPAGTGTRIEVGCKSKVFQIGPLVTRAHSKCVEEIEAALSVPAARIA